MEEPPAKRRRLSQSAEPHPIRAEPVSLTRNISPPLRRSVQPPSSPPPTTQEGKLLPSPFRLTTIRDLSAEANVGAVSLHDLLGDPLISECWEFNYLHDIDFLLSHLDQDVRSLVKVHVIHGNWKREDPSRLMLEEQASQHHNVTLHTAYMPEMFGTHHSKMLILFRHDDTAQVVIHTANMISKDWTNMTNAAWLSPMLPLLSQPNRGQGDAPMGSGPKFKADLLSYLGAYNKQRKVCKGLTDELIKYDFDAVRGTLIASVPGQHPVADDPRITRWGWAGMKHALRSVPIQPGKSEIVAQISSIATLGANDSWIQKTLFDSFSSAIKSSFQPSFKVVFPTPDEVRRSLDGYASGGSIHTKIQSAQQQKQLQYLRPMFCHWANDAASGVVSNGVSSHLGLKDAGRQRAAPHVKTYIRYNSLGTLDWALLTSANISKQAWGNAINGQKEMRIASWEIGVLVWPELLTDDKAGRMVGIFRTDMPSPDDLVNKSGNGEATTGDAAPLVGLRIPYNLPLQKYGADEKPWVATEVYSEPDWQGQIWKSWGT